MPPLKAQLLLEESLSAYFPEMVFTDSGITVQLHRNTQEQLIAKKQAIKSATMQQLLTGRTRLPAFALRPDGTKKGYKPSELGEIPEDWEVCEMGSLGFTYGGLTGKSKKDFGHGNGLYVPFTNVMANIIVDIAKLEKVHVAENQNDVINGDSGIQIISATLMDEWREVANC